MSLEKITAQRALEELKAGHTVYMLHGVDLTTTMTLADWVTKDFVAEAPPAKLETPKVQGGVKPLQRRSWTGERSRRCIMRAGPMRRSQTRWDAQWGLWIPV